MTDTERGSYRYEITVSGRFTGVIDDALDEHDAYDKALERVNEQFDDGSAHAQLTVQEIEQVSDDE